MKRWWNTIFYFSKPQYNNINIDLFCILSYCIYIVSSTSKWSASILIFHIAHFWYIMTLLFPFRNPMKIDILIFGGISTNMCTWSGHASAYKSFTPFRSHNCLSIFPISCLLYFGAKTMWHLQFHVVCDKVCMELLSFIWFISFSLFIAKTSRNP